MARRHLLIGSGPASVAAAEAIRSQDAAAQITIIGAEADGYYSRPGLAYLLAREVPENRLRPFAPKDFERLNVQLLHERAARIEPAAHIVALQDGRVLPYDRLLIATGSQAIPVAVPGADLDGVTKLDDMADVRDLITRSRRAKVAVVVGGGITALEIVEGLRARGVHVHYLVRKNRYWSNVLSESESAIVQQGLTEQGVQIHFFTELAQILGKNGRVSGVQTVDEVTIPCDLVAVAVGVLPQKALAEQAGIECDRGVLVDEYLRSSEPDIFAAGDVAEVCETGSGRRTVEVLWNSAAAKGRIAGLNMATEPVHVFDSGCPLNVTRLAGFKITIMGTVGGGEDSDLKGISRGDSETWRQAGEATVVESTVGATNIRLILGDRTIAGAVVMGDQVLSFPLQELVARRTDVSSILDGLKASNAPIAELIDSVWRSSQVRSA